MYNPKKGTTKMSIPTETIRIKTGCGDMYIISSTDPSQPYLKPILGKCGCCSRALIEAIEILLYELFTRGVNPKELSAKLSGIHCSNDSKFLKSCPEAIAIALSKDYDS